MCVPVSSKCSVLEKRINMLTLNQVNSATCTRANDDNNNTCLSPEALKALALPKPGLRRCLFGAPKAEDSARIIREEDESNRQRMLKLWSWDVARDSCETSGTWVWERVKPVTRTQATTVSRRNLAPVSEHRHHPYPALRFERTSSETSPVVDISIPLAPTGHRVRTTSTSSTSSSSTSSPSEAEDELGSPELSSLSPPSSPNQSCSSTQLTPQFSCTVKVQTRLTDFWRNRRNSCSEARPIKSSDLAIEKRGSSNEVAACSV